MYKEGDKLYCINTLNGRYTNGTILTNIGEIYTITEIRDFSITGGNYSLYFYVIRSNISEIFCTETDLESNFEIIKKRRKRLIKDVE